MGWGLAEAQDTVWVVDVVMRSEMAAEGFFAGMGLFSVPMVLVAVSQVAEALALVASAVLEFGFAVSLESQTALVSHLWIRLWNCTQGIHPLLPYVGGRW